MNPDAYTPDSICASLGLEPFGAEWSRGAPVQQLKLLLCPSFRPETYIQFCAGEDETIVKVTAAREHIWTLDRPARVETDEVEVQLPRDALRRIEMAFKTGLAQPDETGSVMIDGMGVHILWRTYFTTLALNRANASRGDALTKFVAEAISIAHAGLDSREIRTALEETSVYVGLKLRPGG
jgi:hypothetical protein